MVLRCARLSYIIIPSSLVSSFSSRFSCSARNVVNSWYILKNNHVILSILFILKLRFVFEV